MPALPKSHISSLNSVGTDGYVWRDPQMGIFVRGTEVSLIGHDTSADLDLGAGREGGLPPQIKWLSPQNSSPPHTMAV